MNAPLDAPDAEFRPHLSRILSVVLMAGCAVGAVAVLIGGGLRSWPAALPLVVVAYVVWLLFWFPKVVVGGPGVTLVNPLQSLTVPWDAIIAVDTKYALTLVTPRARYTAWAAPAPGATSSFRQMRRSAKAEERDGSGARYSSVRPGDLPTSDSGVAAAAVRRRLDRLAEAGLLDVDKTDQARPVRRVHVLHLAVLLVLLVASFLLPSVL
ncbi:PH domain-containing protein [Zafaria sp. Z1313]|uniref:PH domain-containing protein n=1 Tax=unclassified Zafaria TaxID=2828765 RepID=UPI002E797505|nr:PH domain-containing protein [Zafaria sp. J156]MEE1620414.1 PH domain-containing protein [Zafaria sp. J156]